MIRLAADAALAALIVTALALVEAATWITTP